MSYETKASHGFLRCFLIGEGVGIAVALVILVLFSFMFSMGQLSLSLFEPFSVTAAGLGALVAGFVAAKQRGASGLLTGAIAGAIFWLLLVILGMLLHTGKYDIIGLLIKLVICVVAASLGGILAINARPRKKYLK